MSGRTFEYYLKCINPERHFTLLHFFSDEHEIQFFRTLGDIDEFDCNHCNIRIRIPNKIIEDGLKLGVNGKEIKNKARKQTVIPEIEDPSSIKSNLVQSYCRYCRSPLQNDELELQQGFHTNCYTDVYDYSNNIGREFAVLKQLERILGEPVPQVRDIS